MKTYTLKIKAQLEDIQIDEDEGVIYIPHGWSVVKLAVWLDENEGVVCLL
jgi:hypothetical protein